VSVSFAGHELHSPRFSLAEARELARERFGVEGSAKELGSHQDQNALVDTGTARYVLKIANSAFGEAELDLQNRAMVHLAERLPVGVPLPCAALDGSEIVAVERDGVTYLVRLVTFIEGEVLFDAQHLAAPVLYALGGIAGQVARALEPFDHPAAGRPLRDRRRGAAGAGSAHPGRALRRDRLERDRPPRRRRPPHALRRDRLRRRDAQPARV